MNARVVARHALLLCLLVASAAWGDDTLWNQLRQGGYVLLIRHGATEFGIGDPPGMRLDDCKTQRNLSESGRAEAKRLGEAFRSHGVPVAEVRSSQWCRCLETARLAFGRAEPWPALNSLLPEASRAAEQKREVMAAAERLKPTENLVLVTHSDTIRAFLGVSPSTAEIVAVRYEGGDLKLVGRIPPP